MSYSYNDFGPKEPGDTITVDFTYESREDIEVLVDGVLVEDTLWEWANDGLLLCKAGFPLGATGRVRRITDIADLSGRLVGTAVLDYPTINGNFDRLLFRLQEQDDGEADREARVAAVEQALESQQDNLDASVELGRRWAEEEVDVEVVPGGYSSKHHAVKAGGHASSASSSKDAAIAAKDQAEIARDASVVARGGSESARDLAQKWAEEEEDTEVDSGMYSARHWAAKASSAVLGGIAVAIHEASSKTAPVDADELPLVDSAASWSLKKLTWANLKAALASTFMTISGSLQTITSLKRFNSSLTGINQATGPGTMLEAFAGGTQAAGIAFHRSGVHGSYFGVDTDNRLKWGGWSLGANSYEVWHHGRVNAAGWAVPTAPTESGHVATKQYVDTAVADKAGVYTGSTQDETNFPIGHTIAVVSLTANRNASATVRLHESVASDYTGTGSGAVLAGTWRARGRPAAGNVNMERTA